MATQTTGGGSTTSFSNTPQAVGDSYSYNEDVTGLLTLNVMSNDLGGASKTLFSIDDGTSSSGVYYKGGADADLLTKDGVTTYDTSLDGAHIAIVNGMVTYDVSTLPYNLNSLAAGQTYQDSFVYAIQLGNGTLAWSTVTLTFVGANDAPVITAHTDSGVKEDVAVDGSGNLNASGAVTYTDVDTQDTHSASVLQQAGDLSNVGTFTLDQTNIDTGNGGSIGWSFAVSDDAVDSLSEGQVLTQHYDVTVHDNHGGSAVQTVTVTITGTNEDPVITSTAQSGAVKEDAAVDGSGNLNASGAVTFTDVDTQDTHTASVLQQAGDLTNVGTFTLDQTNHDTGNGGSIGWSFAVSDDAVDSLSEGQVLTQHYDVTVHDNHGGSAVQTVTVTITGTNEDPVITSTAQSGAVKEDAAVDGSGNLNASGAVTFTDVDTQDTHTASFTQQGTDATNVGTFTLDQTNIDTGNGGSIGWSFAVSDDAVDSLSEGQVLTQHYDVTVHDNHGGSAVQTVTVTITGANEDPVITSTAQSGAVKEDAAVDGSGNLNASGAVTFTDVDTQDTHTASFTQQGTDATNVGTFTLDQTNHDTGNGGSIGWSFAVSDDAVDHLSEGQVLTQHYDVTVHDNHGGSAVQTVTVTITGANEDPVITSTAQSGAVKEDAAVDGSGNLNASGAVTFTDVDTQDTHTASFTQQGTDATNVGTFTLDQTNHDTGNGGSIGWSFAVSDDAVDHLSEGQVLTQHYDVTVHDNHGGSAVQTVTVTITGANEDPVITSTAQSGAVKEDAAVDGSGNLNASGAVTFTDVDTQDTHTASVLQQAGDLSNVGTFTLDQTNIDTGNGGSIGWSFAVSDDAVDSLSEGQVLTQHYDVTVHDNHGGSAVQTVTVTITGANEDPVITSTAQSGAVKEDAAVDGSGNLNASGAVTFTDVDTQDTHTASFTQQGTDATNVGTFTLDQTNHDTGNGGSIGWSFAVSDDAVDHLSEGQVLTQHYDVTVHDNHGGSAVQTVTVTITGANEDPVITSTAQSGAVKEDAAVDGSGNLNASGAVTFTDVDTQDTHTASVLQQAGDLSNVGTFTLDQTNIDTGNGGSIGWSFAVSDDAVDHLSEGQVLTQHYDVTVHDNHGGSALQTVTVTITGANEAPVISLGAGDTDTATISEGNAVLSDGPHTLTVVDPDLSDTVTASVTGVSVISGSTTTGLNPADNLQTMLSVTSGAIAADPGAAGNLGWSFNSSPETFNYLAVGQHVTLDYTVQATDSQGVSTTHTVEVTVNGSEDAPTATAATVHLTETSGTDAGTVVSAVNANALTAVSAADVDNGDVVYVSAVGVTAVPSSGDLTVHGTYGDLSIAQNGAYTYTANAAYDALNTGQTGTDMFNFTVSDGHAGGDTPTSLTFSIAGTNEAVVNHAPVNLTFTPVAQNGNNTTLGSFQATDPDGDTLHYSSSDATNFTIDANTGAITAIASPLNEQVTITATDTHNASVSQTYNVLIGNNLSNSLVVSNAGNNPTITDGLNGSDTITGTSGADYMWGGSNNDTFISNAGNDYMSGGGGNNTYQFDTALDAVNNLDRIADFDASKDTLSLAHAIFTAVVGYNTTTGALNSAELANVTNNGTGSSSAHLVYDQTSHTLFYDADGANTTSGRTAFVVLDNVTSLNNNDFHIF